MADNKVWWRCSVNLDHEWLATRSDRLAGHGCPFCSGAEGCPTNNLTLTHSTQAAQLDPDKNGGLIAEQLTDQSKQRVWWKCATDSSHTWKGSAKDFIAKGCPQCPSTLVLTPELTSEWHPTKNDSPTP